MNYLGPDADAKDVYQQNSSAGSFAVTGTAVQGNLSDVMRNATLQRHALHAWTNVANPQPIHGVWPTSNRPF